MEHNAKYYNTLKQAVFVSTGLTILIAILAAVDIIFFNGLMAFSSWGGNQSMAIPTIACFILLGTAFLLQCILIRHVEEECNKHNDKR